jgi:hypothetical protein
MTVGSTLVVAPHSTLCPLGVVRAGQSSPVSDHQTLLSDLQLRPIEASVGAARAISGDEGSAIALEREIAAISDYFLKRHDFAGFCAAQLRLVDEWRARHPASAGSRDHEIVISQYAVRLEAVLGGAPTPATWQSSSLTTSLISTGPFVRSQMVFENPALPAHYLDQEQVPLAVYALGTLMAFAFEAGLDHLTFQSIARTLKANKSLVQLLGWLNEGMVLRQDRSVSFAGSHSATAQLTLVKILRRLLPGRARKTSGITLASILAEELPDEKLQRILVLKEIAPLLLDVLVPAHGGARVRERRPRIRALVQHAVLAHGPDSLFLAASQSQRA